MECSGIHIVLNSTTGAEHEVFIARAIKATSKLSYDYELGQY